MESEHDRLSMDSIHQTYMHKRAIPYTDITHDIQTEQNACVDFKLSE